MPLDGTNLTPDVLSVRGLYRLEKRPHPEDIYKTWRGKWLSGICQRSDLVNLVQVPSRRMAKRVCEWRRVAAISTPSLKRSVINQLPAAVGLLRICCSSLAMHRMKTCSLSISKAAVVWLMTLQSNHGLLQCVLYAFSAPCQRSVDVPFFITAERLSRGLLMITGCLLDAGTNKHSKPTLYITPL